MEKIWLKKYPKEVPEEINPDQYKSIVHLFEHLCAKYRGNKAVSNMGTSLSFTDLDNLTHDFAAYLQKVLKLQKGERIAIMMPNCLQYFVALFGAFRAGLTVVNVNPLYTKRELIEQLNDSGAETILIMENFAHTLEKSLPYVGIKQIITTKLGDLFGFPKRPLINFAVKYLKRLIPPFHLPNAVSFRQALSEGGWEHVDPVPWNSSDPAFLQYTGGTTGVAKGAVLTHRNIIANLLQMSSMFGDFFDETYEVMISPLPLYHIYALLSSCFFTLHIGSESVLITNPKDIPSLIKVLKKTPYTIFLGINTLYNALLQNKKFEELDFSKVKLFFAGGMAVSSHVALRWYEVTGKPIVEAYGLTEASPAVCSNRYDLEEFNGSIGYPIPSTEVEVRDNEGEPVQYGEIGELYIRGPQVMKEYWNSPEETAKVLTEDGWLATGDMVLMDNRGLVYLVDRKKDMINVSGFNVYPNEVEEVLMSHPDVLEAAVIGVPDESTGEAVKTFVVPVDPKLKEDEVFAHCREQLTKYKRPTIVEFVEELPKTAVGKISRRILREKEGEVRVVVQVNQKAA